MGLLKNKNGELKIGNILILSVISVFIIWAATFLIASLIENPGQIGDSFGMVNALFSALAFSLLIYTSLLQTQELKLQREELRENRKQLESSAKAHNELVNLTKVINRDKLIPQYSIEDFKKQENDYSFYLRVLFGEVIFQKIDYIKKNDSHLERFVVSRSNESIGLKAEGDLIGKITVQNFNLDKVNKLILSYSLSNGNYYSQEITNLTGEWKLDFPKSIADILVV